MPPLADDHVTGVPEVQTDFSSPESTTIAGRRCESDGCACATIAVDLAP